MSTCITCEKQDKINTHRLDPLYFPIIYQNARVITSLTLPRLYTSTHNDDTKQIFLSIGPKYDEILLNTPEVINVETEILGKWVKKNDKYRIQLTAIVSTEKNPQAQIRNIIICKELGVVLEGIAFAETALLKRYPCLKDTKIYIHFKSIDPAYDRTEYWGKLGYWSSKK